MSRRAQIALLVTMAALLIAVVVTYYACDPSGRGWALHCPSKYVTGYDCPACGTQRMLHALLHGHLAQAWHYNAFAFLSLPFFALTVWSAVGFLPGSRRLQAITSRPIVAWAYIAAFFAWWLIRNL